MSNKIGSLSFSLLLALLPGGPARAAVTEVAAATVELQQLQAQEQNFARVLAEQGFEPYAALFHPDYSHWADGGPLRDRASFLAAVRDWYQAGNHAVATQMRPIQFEIVGELALARYELREDFNDGSSFVGRFFSVLKREQGQWLAYRTNFQTLYSGRSESAPVLNDPAPPPRDPAALSD